MHTDIAFYEEATKKIAKGVNTIADAVESTLGPDGSLVLLGTNPVRSTKDGVTVARAVRLEDDMEELAASVVRDASLKTAEEVGDGTTTTVVFTRALYNACLDEKSPEEAIKKVREEVGPLIEYLKSKIRKDIPLKDIALISANGDEMVANLVSSVQEQIGPDGTVVLEESRAVGVRTEVFGGFFLPIGLLSYSFVNDTRSTKAELVDTPVAVFKGRVNYLTQISKILEQCVKSKSPIVIVAEDFSEEVVSTLLLNKQNGILRVALVRHLDMFEHLNDLAISLGATLVTGDLTEDDLGWADRFSADMKSSTFIRNEDNDEVVSLSLQLKEQIAQENNIDKIRELEGRLANINGKAAVIRIGAATVSETKELKDRVEDAVCAVKSAAKYGSLLGAGKSMFDASFVVSSPSLREALQTPQAILGVREVDVYDPAMATIRAIENGVSACSILLNTKVLIVPNMKGNHDDK